jgi:CRP/FNR family transcriptional regulator, cyclic AMP receptor protein
MHRLGHSLVLSKQRQDPEPSARNATTMCQAKLRLGGSQSSRGERDFSLFPAAEYPAKVRLFQQGSRAECAYFVASGITKLTCVNPSGKELIVGLRGPGSLLGTAAVILSTVYPATASTVTPCSLRRVSATDLDGLLSTNLDFGLRPVLQEMQAREVHAHLELMIDVVSRTAQYRLAKLLFDAFVIRDMHSETDRSLPIPLKQWEIAELLAVTPEHTSRVLRRLEKEGLISRKRNILFVLDAQRLASFLDETWSLRSDESPLALAEGPAGRIKSGHLSQCVANKGSLAASPPPHIAAHEHIQDFDKTA